MNIVTAGFTSFILAAAAAQPSSVSALPPTLDPTYSTAPVAGSQPAPSKPAGPASKWIWTAVAADNQTVFARTSFSLAHLPKSASLYATADDFFEIYVNGHKLGETLTPADSLAWTNVQRFPIISQLRVGNNVIAIRAVNHGGPAGVLARLDVDGSELLTTDEHWRITDKSDLPAEWTQAGFEDSGWPAATVVAALGDGAWGNSLDNWPGAKEAAYMKHLFIPSRSAQVIAGGGQITGAETLAANGEARLQVTPDAAAGAPTPALIVDFGQELAGRVQVWGTDGAAVTVTTGELREECDHAEPSLDNHGPFPLKLAGSEPASTPYTAFRYAKLTFPGKAPVTITRVSCDHKYYPVQYKGSFDCSDPLLTRIWYTGAYTAHLCMQEEIWDAPKRDRGLWIGDLQVTGQTISVAFADRFLMEHSIEKVRDEAQHGRPPAQIAAADVNGLPGYSAAWFCTLADFHRHLGDEEFLKRQHEKILSLLALQRTEFDANDAYINGKKWDFCDWAAGFVLDGPLARATTHLYIIYGLHEAVFLLRELGDAANADRYAAWADQLTAAARARFADPAAHTYSDRLQENVMAVLSGAATPEQRGAIFPRFLRADSPVWQVRQTGNIDESEAMSPYYGYFVLQAMEQLGEHQAGIDLIRRYWGEMLRRGATTFWEKFDPAWPQDMKETLDKMPYLSLSHGWSSGPTSFLTETVLGVRPTSPGYRTAEIRPQLGDLAWAEGDTPTPSGPIHVRVERQGDRTTAMVRLPANVRATILLSGKSLQADRAGDYQISAP